MEKKIINTASQLKSIWTQVETEQSLIDTGNFPKTRKVDSTSQMSREFNEEKIIGSEIWGNT